MVSYRRYSHPRQVAPLTNKTRAHTHKRTQTHRPQLSPCLSVCVLHRHRRGCRFHQRRRHRQHCRQLHQRRGRRHPRRRYHSRRHCHRYRYRRGLHGGRRLHGGGGGGRRRRCRRRRRRRRGSLLAFVQCVRSFVRGLVLAVATNQRRSLTVTHRHSLTHSLTNEGTVDQIVCVWVGEWEWERTVKDDCE